METLEWIIGGILLALSVALVIVIGMQQSKRKSGLSGSIAGTGASESYLSRNKIANKSTTLKKVTVALTVAFVILVLALFIVGTIDPVATETASSAAASTVA